MNACGFRVILLETDARPDRMREHIRSKITEGEVIRALRRDRVVSRTTECRLTYMSELMSLSSFQLMARQQTNLSPYIGRQHVSG